MLWTRSSQSLTSHERTDREPWSITMMPGSPYDMALEAIYGPVASCRGSSLCSQARCAPRRRSPLVEKDAPTHRRRESLLAARSSETRGVPRSGRSGKRVSGAHRLAGEPGMCSFQLRRLGAWCLVLGAFPWVLPPAQPGTLFKRGGQIVER
jgi:hypothetical protein